MLYIILYIIIHIIMGALAYKALLNGNKNDEEILAVLVFFFAPCVLIYALITKPSFFFGWIIPKKKPREVVPGTYNGYLWGEVVIVGDKKGIVIGCDGDSSIRIIYINSQMYEWVNVGEITSTQKPSELAEELALFKQSNELLAKADAIVKEAGEIKMKAVKKRSNLIYVP